jgi:hypothetical protein
MPEHKVTAKEKAIFVNGNTLPRMVNIKFPNGSVGHFSPSCVHCHKVFASGYFKGTITTPLPHVASVVAAGWCPGCKVLSMFTLRFRADGAVERCVDGVWSRQEPTPTIKSVCRGLRAKVRRSVISMIAFFLLFLPLVLAVIRMPR